MPPGAPGSASDYKGHAARGRVKLLGEASLQVRAALIGALLLVAAAAAPLAADARDDAKARVEFGIKVAQLGLWREALAHWERAVKLDPSYAEAYNNLAIGYEHQGEFEKARSAYEKALELNPNNTYIKQNYELFKEINDRTNKPDGR
jgi:Tfp pilus assembly protein PilF